MHSPSAICTLTTASHLFKALALAASVHRFSPELKVEILLTDGNAGLALPDYRGGPLRIRFLSELALSGTGKLISDKYRSRPDPLRWSLKPVFLKYLLEKDGYEQVIYVDNDIFFVNPLDFLFDLLIKHPVLLSPHWRPSGPDADPIWRDTNFREGVFNAGFFGAGRHGVKALDWWASCCAWKCERNFMLGLWDDQKYLDLMPVIEPGTGILQHKGCNVAYWNLVECPRTRVGGEIRVAGEFPVVFIHFAESTLQGIGRGEDPLLDPFMKAYFEELEKYQPAFDRSAVGRQRFFRPYLKMLWWKLAHLFRQGG